MSEADTSVFRRFISVDEQKPEITAQKLQPAQMLLTWLQRWNKATISEREIRIYGPRPLRSRESARRSAEELVRHAWLRPLQMRPHDMRAWEIVRKPTLSPTVATVARAAEATRGVA
jgi:hypothetical protein